MTNIEIPYNEEKTRLYRFFEMLPGLLSWGLLLGSVILSIAAPKTTVFIIILYLLLWFARAVGLNVRVLQGWRKMQQHMKLPWRKFLDELEAGDSAADFKRPDWHLGNIAKFSAAAPAIKPSEVVHAIILATYNETRSIIEPSIKALLASDYNAKQVIFVLAYEERGGHDVKTQANQLISDYGKEFLHSMATPHPADIPGEIVGKGGNITFAGRELEKYIHKAGIDPLKVIVTTLDADHRVHSQYLAGLTYMYCVTPDPVTTSFQPIPMFTNNIWDVPAPMRVIATGNSFWMIVQALRPHTLRNFASHAQSLRTLIDTDYWSVRTIVEDGHQFWRTYIRYDGNHSVYPIFIPIYQDAVLSSTLKNTLKSQFIQIRRWAWGASDVPYLITKGFFTKNKIPKLDLTLKVARLLEGHISWATAPLILAFASFIPSIFNPEDIAATQLPFLASRIQRFAMIGIVITLFLSFKALPPKPARYKAHRNIFMVLQWLYLPLTSIVYSSFAAIYSQTRLLFGRYLGKFDVTEKATKE